MHAALTAGNLRGFSAQGWRLDGSRRLAGRRRNLNDLEILDRLRKQLGQADHAGGRHRNARVNRHDGNAGAISHDAGSEIEIHFFGADAHQRMVCIARSEVVIFELKDLLRVGGLIGHAGLLISV